MQTRRVLRRWRQAGLLRRQAELLRQQAELLRQHSARCANPSLRGEQVGEEIVVDEIVGESESGGDAGDGSVERDVEPVEEAAIEEEDRSE